MRPPSNPLSLAALLKLILILSAAPFVTTAAHAQLHDSEKYLIEQAKVGQAEHQHNLGAHYYNRRDRRAVKVEQAIEWFERAANQNFLPSVRALIEVYTARPDLKIPPGELARRLEQALALGDTQVSTRLGLILWDGADKVPADRPRAYRILIRESLRGDEPATLFFITRALDGVGAQRDPAKATKLLHQLAHRGSTIARIQEFFLRSDAVALPPADSVLPELMARAEQGEPRAMYLVGAAMEARILAVKDEKNAVSHPSFAWFAKAAEQNEPDALLRLGQAASFTAKTPADFGRAAAFFERAGTDTARLHLAKLILQRKIPEGSPDRLRLLLEAAAATEPEALFELGMTYYEGRNVATDYAKAAELFTKSAESGNARACINLGVIAINGEAGPSDLTKAVMWWLIAQSSGHGEAGAYLKRVASRLSPEATQTSKRLAEEWVENLQRRQAEDYPKLIP